MPSPPPIYVFEDSQVDRLFPLTYSRAACELRSGNLTLLERLRRNLPQPVSGLLVRPALAEVVRKRITDIPVNPPLSTKEGILLMNARCLFLKSTSSGWQMPSLDSVGLSQGTIAWICLSPALAGKVDVSKLHESRTLDALLADIQRQSANIIMVNRPWDLFDHQRAAMTEDFAALGPASDGTLMPGCHLLNAAQIHVGKGARVWPGAVLDAQGGPIMIGEGTEIRANSVVTGPVAIGAHCLVRNLADIREETTLGPNCRVGGEVIGSIFLGNSNKQHHGFVGQTIIGEWVNLGAGTTTSNVKNTYGSVRMTLSGKDEPTGRQFLGSLIADHVKLGIGTYLSTGSVVGFASHVVVPRPPRVVPSFAWLTDKGLERADFEKIEEIAGIVMKRRGVEFTPHDHALFVHIASVWSQTEGYPWPEG